MTLSSSSTATGCTSCRYVQFAALLLCVFVLLLGLITVTPPATSVKFKLLTSQQTLEWSCKTATGRARASDSSSIQAAVAACYNTSWIAPQRPLPGSNDRSLAAAVLEAYPVWPHPRAPALHDYGPIGSPQRMEVENRLVVAIACGLSLKGVHVSNISELPVVNMLMSSFLPTARPAYVYRVYSNFESNLTDGDRVRIAAVKQVRHVISDATSGPCWTEVVEVEVLWRLNRFYFAYDYDEPWLAKPLSRDSVATKITDMMLAEDSSRWHPQGYIPGKTIDPSALLISVHWVHCNYTGKPSWAHNDAVMAAYKDGADYVMRVNNDTIMPTRPDWLEVFVSDLRVRHPVPNLGVVGPFCALNPRILTYDFTHWTHVAIFRYHYPRSLPNWFSDDWIDHVYRRFNMSVMLRGVTVTHVQLPMRYKVSDYAGGNATLHAELDLGAAHVQSFVSRQFGIDLLQTNKTSTVGQSR